MNERIKELAEQREKKAREDFKNQYELVMSTGSLDGDGYPTENALKLITLWDFTDCKGWFKYIESIWHLKSWGWSEQFEPHAYKENKKVYTYHISTAGWSGNEAIISAMMKNNSLWYSTWVQSRRGGHYIFEDNEFE